MGIAGRVVVVMMIVVMIVVMIGMGVFVFVIGSRLGCRKFGGGIGDVDNLQTLGIVTDLFLHAALEGHPGGEPDFGTAEAHRLSGGR